MVTCEAGVAVCHGDGVCQLVVPNGRFGTVFVGNCAHMCFVWMERVRWTVLSLSGGGRRGSALRVLAVMVACFLADC